MESVAKKEKSVSLIYVAIGINILISILFHGFFSIYGYSRGSIDDMILPLRIIVWATVFCFPEFKDSFLVKPIRRKLKSIIFTWIALLSVFTVMFLAVRFLFLKFADFIRFGFGLINVDLSENILNVISFILFVGGFVGIAYFVAGRLEYSESESSEKAT